MWSVAQAAQAVGEEIDTLDFWKMPGVIRQEPDGPRFAPGVERRVREHDGTVCSMIGGAVPSVVGFLVHPRRFDFVLPAAPGLPLDPAAELIPASAVRRLLETHMAEYLALMSLVRSLCRGRMVHAEPPPPCAAPERLHPEAVPWALFPDRCREVSPVALRYKLWRLHSQILSEWCARHGVDLLPAPPASHDDEGHLRESFCADGLHGNQRYGALVLKQVRQLS